jgi:hypothetical protein
MDTILESDPTQTSSTISNNNTQDGVDKETIRKIVLEMEKVIEKTLNQSVKVDTMNSPIVKASFSISVPRNAHLDKYGNIEEDAFEEFPEELVSAPTEINLGGTD